MSSNKVDDADCFEMLCETYNSKEHDEPKFNCNNYKQNIEIVSYDSRIAKGPCDARSKLSALIAYDYEHASNPRLTSVNVHDYCMQIDSHMDFSKKFDTKLIQMFHRSQNDRAVLSTYVAPMEQTDTDPKEVPNLCMITFTSTWRNWGTKFLRRAKKPKLTNLVWGAGMSFSKCHGELNVPYDPYLDGVFDGEETSRGIRFFTHGYDVYTPDKVLVTHDYHGHQGNPVVHTWGHSKNANLAVDPSGGAKSGFDLLDKVDWSFMNVINSMRSKFNIQPIGTKRLNVLMGTSKVDNADIDVAGAATTKDLIQKSRYGLGTVRTLDQAYEFAGFDPINHKMLKNNCGNLKWVPYPKLNNEDQEFGVGETLQRKYWSENDGEVESILANSNVAAAAVTAGGGSDGGQPQQNVVAIPNVPIPDPREEDIKAVPINAQATAGGGGRMKNLINNEKIHEMEVKLQQTQTYTSSTAGLTYLFILVLIFVLRSTHTALFCKKQKLKNPKSN